MQKNNRHAVCVIWTFFFLFKTGIFFGGGTICIHEPFFKRPPAIIHHISNFAEAQMAVHSSGLNISEPYMELRDGLKIVITYYCL